MTHHYLVADHLFDIEAAPEQLACLTNYEPFCLSTLNSKLSIPSDRALGQRTLFSIRVTGSEMPSTEGWEHLYTDKSDEDMPRIEMYSRPGQWLFRVSVYRDSEIVSSMICSEDWSDVQLSMQSNYTRFAIDNAAMLVYAFATAGLGTLLFHSSVILRQGQGCLFLGHSGTGKSTHSRQWLEAFNDAELINDDNPVVRILSDGSVRVYGSPWSGKTPCYRNISAPVAALVQLAQAPHNEIKLLRMSQAYPYILASVSGLKVMPEMMDRLYESIAQLLEKKPVYKLECLPNTDAARLCAQTCLP